MCSQHMGLRQCRPVRLQHHVFIKCASFFIMCVHNVFAAHGVEAVSASPPAAPCAHKQAHHQPCARKKSDHVAL
eukprot:1157119-Pelagomonas_calceolata.AAC.8